MLKADTHVNGVGSFTPEMKEMDQTAIKKADQIYVDDMRGVQTKPGN